MTEPRLFDLKAAAEYLQSLGAAGTTAYYIRSLVASGKVPHIKLGRKFYISKNALDAWLERAEKRSRC